MLESRIYLAVRANLIGSSSILCDCHVYDINGSAIRSHSRRGTPSQSPPTGSQFILRDYVLTKVRSKNGEPVGNVVTR